MNIWRYCQTNLPKLTYLKFKDISHTLSPVLPCSPAHDSGTGVTVAMRRLHTVVAGGAAVLIASIPGPAAATPAAGTGGDTARLVIGYRPGSDGTELIPVHVRLGAQVIRYVPALHAAVVALPPDTTAASGPLDMTLSGDEAAAAATIGNRDAAAPLPPDVAAAAHLYAAQPAVVFVERDAHAAVAGAPAALRPSGPAAEGPGPSPTGDPLAGRQWHLDAVRLPAAWRRIAADGIAVAVVDTGVEAAHPDLVGALAPGWSTIDGTTDTRDRHGHGTAVAGVIAAGVGNGVGVAGAAPGARIVPIRALGADGTGWMSDVAAGIVWGADHGARVIVVAAGSPTPLRLVGDAVAYATRRGALVVAAAGNAGAAAVDHPAADDGALAVAAVDAHGALAPWSNHGPAVALAAPGAAILTTARGGGYAAVEGTSVAAAIVGGAAALRIAQEPAAAPGDIARRLVQRSAPAPAAPGAPQPPGLVDADAATDPAPAARLPGDWRKPRLFLPSLRR